MKKVFSIDEGKWDTELKEAEEFFEKIRRTHAKRASRRIRYP
jgi:hypothetical protein